MFCLTHNNVNECGRGANCFTSSYVMFYSILWYEWHLWSFITYCFRRRTHKRWYYLIPSVTTPIYAISLYHHRICSRVIVFSFFAQFIYVFIIPPPNVLILNLWPCLFHSYQDFARSHMLTIQIILCKMLASKYPFLHIFPFTG